MVKKGKPVSVRFIKDRNGKPVLDSEGGVLEISLKDIKRQIFEKSQLSQE